jgi:hypothetical protein
VTPAFLVLFAAGSASLDRWSLPMTHRFGRILGALAEVPSGKFGKQASVAVRPFLVLLLVVPFAVGRRLCEPGAVVCGDGTAASTVGLHQ